MSAVTIERATLTYREGLVALNREAAEELGQQLFPFDPAYASADAVRAVTEGVGFVAIKDGEVIGALLFDYIRLSYAKTPHLETSHFYVSPRHRHPRVTLALMRAAEDYADDTAGGLLLVWNQINYGAAIVGRQSNTDRIETLYQSRGYERVGEAFARQPSSQRNRFGRETRVIRTSPRLQRVGISYVYRGGPKPAGEGASRKRRRG